MSTTLAHDSSSSLAATMGPSETPKELADIQTPELDASSDVDSGRISEDKDIERQASNRPDVDPSHEKPGTITRVVTAQDWTGPDDPENPLNWSTARKVYITTVPAFMGFAVTLGSSVYVPGIPDIEAEFQISNTVALLGLSMWVLGLGFGPVLAAPISETLGRSAVYRASIPLSALFTLGAGFSQNAASLIICRFFAGFFGSPTLAVGAGTNADIWPPIHRASATVLFIWAPFAGPALSVFCFPSIYVQPF